MRPSAHPWLWQAGIIVVYGAAISFLGVGTPGCSGGGAGGAGGTSSPSNTVTVQLGSLGLFSFVDLAESKSQTVPTDVAGDVPVLPVQSAAISIDPADVTVTAADSTGPASADIVIRVGESGSADLCTDGIAMPTIGLALDESQTLTVSPESVNVPASAVAQLASGVFDTCVTVTVNNASEVDVSSFDIDYNTPLDFASLDCAEIMATPAVQAAVATLADNGFTFKVNSGTDPVDITNQTDLPEHYLMTDRVFFDPDDADTASQGEGRVRNIRFSEQSGTRILRSHYPDGDESNAVSIRHSIEGSGRDVTMCMVARTNAPGCDQTLARVETVLVSEDGSVAEGDFLAVVLEEHVPTDATCGNPGDFAFGTVVFRISFGSIGTTSDTTETPTEGDTSGGTGGPSDNTNDNSAGDGSGDTTAGDNGNDNSGGDSTATTGTGSGSSRDDLIANDNSGVGPGGSR